MKTLQTLGKYMYILPIAVFGIFHFKNAEAMSGMVPSFLPYQIFWVYLTGAALIIAALAVIFEKKAKLALQLLGLMLLLFALMLHLPGAIEGNQMSMTMFLKDMGLAGAAWIALKNL
jgi:uncharacterized membrane protein